MKHILMAFSWGGERKNKGHIPREARSRDSLSKRNKNETCLAKSGIFCHRSIQEIRTSKLDSSRQNIYEYCLKPNLRHRVLTSFIVITKLRATEALGPRNVEKMAGYLKWRRRFGKRMQSGFWNSHHGTVNQKLVMLHAKVSSSGKMCFIVNLSFWLSFALLVSFICHFIFSIQSFTFLGSVPA